MWNLMNKPFSASACLVLYNGSALLVASTYSYSRTSRLGTTFGTMPVVVVPADVDSKRAIERGNREAMCIGANLSDARRRQDCGPAQKSLARRARS